jgi:lysozyme family protein
MSDVVDRALQFTLKWEGGYANHPLDPGGATNFGVTQRTYDSFRKGSKLPAQAVKLISPDEVKAIYLGYWRDACCDRIALISKRAAIANFDCAINCGSVTAIKLIQRAAQAKDDGIYGSNTQSCINEWVSRKDEPQLTRRIIHQRHLYYARICKQNHNLNEFLEGWLKRCWDLQMYLLGDF